MVSFCISNVCTYTYNQPGVYVWNINATSSENVSQKRFIPKCMYIFLYKTFESGPNNLPFKNIYKCIYIENNLMNYARHTQDVLIWPYGVRQVGILREIVQYTYTYIMEWF